MFSRVTAIAAGAVLAAATLVPRPASAVIRQYFSSVDAQKLCEMTTLITTCAFTDPQRYHPSFFALRSPQNATTVTPSPHNSYLYAIQDEGQGKVTLHYLGDGPNIGNGTANFEGIFGPGGIIFTRSRSAGGGGPATPQGPFTGSTSVGGSIDWGLVTGWTGGEGEIFCASQNSTLCSVIAFSEDMSVASSVPSATYDIGTWTFHASGFDGTPYIVGTNLGGSANRSNVFNGGFIDNELPALPLVGLGGLAVALVALSAREVRRGADD